MVVTGNSSYISFDKKKQVLLDFSLDPLCDLEKKKI